MVKNTPLSDCVHCTEGGGHFKRFNLIVFSNLEKKSLKRKLRNPFPNQ